MENSEQYQKDMVYVFNYYKIGYGNYSYIDEPKEFYFKCKNIFTKNIHFYEDEFIIKEFTVLGVLLHLLGITRF